LNGLKLEVVTLGENGITEDDILVHDAHEPDPVLHSMLVRMAPPVFPTALGIIRAVEAPTYDELIEAQYQQSKAKATYSNMDELLNSGNTWEV
ncbi:MAG: 2-oxoacid:ferredoxin oxidoreductase subunit beta, partial [Bacteroidetes bacterium]